MITLRKRLSDSLVKSKAITKEHLEQALKLQKAEGGSLSQILVKLGFVKEEELLTCFSRELNLLPMDLAKYSIPPEVISLVPEKVARHYQLLPISRSNGTLTVAMVDPLNLIALDHLKILTGFKLTPVITTRSDLADALQRYYSPIGVVDEIVKSAADLEVEVTHQEEEEEIDTSLLLAEGEGSPVIKLVNFILNQAIQEKASDIHIEPAEAALRIRYRIDGLLQERFSIPKRMQPAVISRIKIISELDIAERRLAQDGRFQIRIGGKEVDFRVNVIPTSFGEKMTLRILDKSSLTAKLGELGLQPDSLRKVEESLVKPYGMILITGPTGSGKTTTLYSALSQVNAPDRQIMTVEDPVEYRLPGINQVQVRSDIGLTFASGLRAMLRADPDVVMVGEIRDEETAAIAIKAALTGHLTFSTLHTNDAVGAIGRLMDMGIEPFLMASSLLLIAAQRLARQACHMCKEPYHIPESVLEAAGFKVDHPKEVTFYRGRGCRECNNTGYRGRFGVMEVLVIDEEIKELISKRASTQEIKQVAIARGMRTLRQNGWESIKAGVTTLEEILRVTSEI